MPRIIKNVIPNTPTGSDKSETHGSLQALADAVQCRKPVTGLSHDLYKYPARFSPQFARGAIAAFTNPGDLIIDPFSGGGTSLIEAKVNGRRGIGVDLSELATFVAKVKTRVYKNSELRELRRWGKSLVSNLNLRRHSPNRQRWEAKGYLRNLTGRKAWPIRKAIELALDGIDNLSTLRLRQLGRIALLRASQIALDGRKCIPSIATFRNMIADSIENTIEGAYDFASAIANAKRNFNRYGRFKTQCLCRSSVGLEHDPFIQDAPTPNLILTSPPYPGIHVLYHRWQIGGGKEASAPFWITDTDDGHGASYYTLGGRHQKRLKKYFELAEAVFHSLYKISGPNTTVVQLVAFSDHSWQLPQYLSLMDRAGFQERNYDEIANNNDGRLWRNVPGRKWHASLKGRTSSSQEVLLIHQPK
ncbi:MAG: DNA methyltransferase [Planctomycetota bacterium]|jgi:hypothetical protein